MARGYTKEGGRGSGGRGRGVMCSLMVLCVCVCAISLCVCLWQRSLTQGSSIVLLHRQLGGGPLAVPEARGSVSSALGGALPVGGVEAWRGGAIDRKSGV